MNYDPKVITLIGLCTAGILWILGFEKKLRSDRTLSILIIPALVMALIGLLIKDDSLEMKGGNAANSFLSPFVYLILYWILRKLYLRIYRREPTYNRSSWYDWEEGRKQNWLDVTVHLAPVVLSLIVGFIL